MSERIHIPMSDYASLFSKERDSAVWSMDHLDQIAIRCVCGRVMWLDHEIDANGVVNPSLWHDEPECGWHVMATLDGYSTRWETLAKNRS